ncbi:unnamed protein product [Umbelopsis sp. WA50703]
MFGPYVMLQTLGEGEFGKVKLAIHAETGQEVAIKLIRKQSIGTSSRLNKVQREISVLKVLHHPYIVKLYDVVETEKYIGIILECASGGELFEYILARRYLKERDAKRLFAQLISGVRYMHEKHIVHRDLKLENLLLDRHRNVIITDFGFANQFAAAKDDLMATSCGSPCYAAPELVVSDGLYVGSAVDIWSCGVILYAMLCGYLPFDDDPANPDGENINLLYRYILNTPLMFPSHIASDARDLLRIMLVPDPRKRCSIQDIMKHRWLKDYQELFDQSMEQVEADAMDAVEKASPPSVNHTVSPPVEPQLAPQHSEKEQVVPSTDHQMQDLEVGLQDVENENDDVNITDVSNERLLAETPEESYVDAMEVQEPPLNEAATTAIDQSTLTSQEEVNQDTTVSLIDSQPMLNVMNDEQNTGNDNVTLMEIESSAPKIDHSQMEVNQEDPSPDISNSDSKHTSFAVSDVSSSSGISSKDPEQQSASQMEGNSRRASAIPASILQSRFLSSMQRSQSAGAPAVSKSLSNNDSARSVSFNMQPKPDTPAPRSGPKSGSQTTSGLFTRGTRRKALSLLTRPTTEIDHDLAKNETPRARRNSSIKPGSTPQSVRLVVNSVSKDGSEPISTWGSVSLVPSTSERVVNLDRKSKSKGFMEWFRKKAHVTPAERGASPLNKIDEINYDRPPLTPQPPGMNKIAKGPKPDVESAADYRLKVHNGVIDQQALTSRPPFEVLVEIKQCLTSMGLTVKAEGDYKLKCVRNKRKNKVNRTNEPDYRRKMSSGSTLRSLLRRASAQNPSRESIHSIHRTSSEEEPPNAMSSISSIPEQPTTIYPGNSDPLHIEPMYGDPATDPGEEVRFTVEICRLKNLPGIYIVDINRLRGNVWAYKCLYQKLLDLLDLKAKGDILPVFNKIPPTQENTAIESAPQ